MRRRVIYVEGVPSTASKEVLHEIFREFGEIDDIQADTSTRPWAKVFFRSSESAEKVLLETEILCYGQPLKCDYAKTGGTPTSFASSFSSSSSSFSSSPKTTPRTPRTDWGNGRGSGRRGGHQVPIRPWRKGARPDHHANGSGRHKGNSASEHSGTQQRSHHGGKGGYAGFASLADRMHQKPPVSPPPQSRTTDDTPTLTVEWHQLWGAEDDLNNSKCIPESDEIEEKYQEYVKTGEVNGILPDFSSWGGRKMKRFSKLTLPAPTLVSIVNTVFIKEVFADSQDAGLGRYRRWYITACDDFPVHSKADMANLVNNGVRDTVQLTVQEPISLDSSTVTVHKTMVGESSGMVTVDSHYINHANPSVPEGVTGVRILKIDDGGRVIYFETMLPESVEEMAKSFLKAKDYIEFSRLGKEWKLIGQGNFGCVYQAEYVHNKVAVKELKASTAERDHKLFKNKAARFFAEIQHLSEFRFDYIVTFFGWSTSKQTVYMVMELCDSSLLKEIRQMRELSREFVLRVAHDLGRAVKFIHDKNYVHLDIAARNIFLKSNQFKLGDFGLCCQSGEPAPTLPVLTAPPEALSAPRDKRHATFALDMWMVGVCLWECLSKGKQPYTDLTSDTQVHKTQAEYERGIVEGELELEAIHDPDPAIWEELVAPCINRDPERRMKALEFIEVGDRLQKASMVPSDEGPFICDDNSYSNYD